MMNKGIEVDKIYLTNRDEKEKIIEANNRLIGKKKWQKSINPMILFLRR